MVEEMARKVKAPAAPVRIAQSREEAARMIGQIGHHQRVREGLQTAMNAELARVKDHYERLARPHADKIVELTKGVQGWCEANRDALTQGGKTKTAQLATGEVRWRTTPPAVTLRGVEEILAALKEKKLDRFIRTKEEVNKEAILAEQDAVDEIAGITIGQREEFVILPFETKLEEVA
jgi:phage host-nuclease inhibitor protein Gam